MNTTFSNRITLGLASLGIATAALTGCGIGPTNTSSGPLEGTFQIQGKVHGGEQPVVGSNIQVFVAGTTGYGTGAASIMTAAVTTNPNGFFQLTGKYTCPSSTSLVYITATGGDPGIGSSNSAIKLASAIGTCAQLQTASYVWINEVTTAATAFALAQYYGAASGGFGAPNNTQAQLGLSNAIATVGNLVDSTAGTAVTTAIKVNATLGNVTTTPEAAKLYTIANILAACVNSDGGASSACQTTLFPDVTPTGGTAPTDTLAAAVLMNTNPTSNNSNGSAANLTALYGLQTATAPFVGVSSQPNDWTIAILYSAGTSTTQSLINGINDLAVDGNGNVWIINYNTGAATTESMAEFSPTGTPLANPFNGGGAAGATTMSSASPRNISIDNSNDVFAATSSGSAYVYEYLAGGSTTSLALGSQAYGLAINGADLYVSHNSGTTIGFEYYPGGTLASTNRIEFPYSASPLSQATYAAYATNGTLYLSLGAAASTVTAVTNRVSSACVTFPCVPANTSATYSAVGSSLSTPWGMAAASGGGMWVANSGATSVTYLTTDGATSTTYGTSASFNAPRKIAVDGNNVAWVINRGNGGVSEVTTNGTILSPVPTGVNTSPVGFVHTGTGAVTSIATDPSGNVWVGNGAVGTATGGNSFVEIVGVAAPTVTPISLALSSGKVGAKP